VFGYELLYRHRATDESCDRRGSLISAEVLTQAILGIGLDTLTNGHRAFLNFAQDVLLSGVGTVLPPALTVIEVLEGTAVDERVVTACRQLQDAGYAMALDDFAEASPAEGLLRFATFAKIDVLNTPPAVVARLARRLAARGIQLIAENVETEEAAANAAAMGFRLFQGFHFCRPTTIAGTAMAPAKVAQVRLAGALAARDLTIDRIEDIVSRDVALTYRVLRCVNSAAFGQTKEIHSIRQALVLLGVDHIRKWAMVWSLAAVNASNPPELLTVALVRARTCELLAEQAGNAHAPEYFLLGLCSLLDAILRQPLERAVADIPLSDFVREALLGDQRPARSILDAVVAYERGEWDAAIAAIAPLGLPVPALPRAYAEALEWPRAFAAAA